MKRRNLLIALAVSLVAPIRAPAQRPPRVYRIGVLLSTSRTHLGAAMLLQPFEQGLRQLGYAEGRNLTIAWREAENRPERLPGLAAELAALKVDLIVAGAPEAVLAAKSATEAIPIIFVASTDPVGQGLVKSLARPGTNITGFASFSETIIGKRMELLKEVLPRMSRLAALHGPGDALAITAMREFSGKLKLQLRLHKVQGEADLESAFRKIAQERTEALLVFATTITYAFRARVVEFAAGQRLPTIYGLAEFVETGGLMSYAFSYADNWRRSVAYVDKILKGAKPADLPVQQPTTLELVVNLNTARALGITIPQPILLRANRVIE